MRLMLFGKNQRFFESPFDMRSWFFESLFDMRRFFKLALFFALMKNEEYSGNYELKIRLADSAWSNEDYRKRVESGELEKMINDSKGVLTCWKGVERKYQNVPTFDNFNDALELMKKLNELPYVCELTFSKAELKSRIGYIPVKD